MSAANLTPGFNADSTSEWLAVLERAIALLQSSQPDLSLAQDWQALCRYQTSTAYRIAVFGPFNYGKSTLLNALLGEKALPIDLIPTTGAAIAVRYGAELRSRIWLNSGEVVEQAGTDLLKQYARLDEQRCMRSDVTQVEVFCPHPLLQFGVELLDLPGTDDAEAQEQLVKQELLTADLVLQVLDGRKLMTLMEREHLRDWLSDRGLTTVIFVVNFLNLIEAEEQRHVMTRMRFVAESFRASLPEGVSNLYRVDALPALRSRLQGDGAAAQMAGLPMLEAAIQRLVADWGTRTARLDANAKSSAKSGANLGPTAQPSRGQARLESFAGRVREALQLQVQQLEAAIASTQQSRTAQRLDIQRKAQRLLNQGFEQELAKLRSWASVVDLQMRYGVETTDALQRMEFSSWEAAALRRDWEEQCRSLVEWVEKACEFFNQPRPATPWFRFPPEPQIVWPTGHAAHSSSAGGTRDGLGTAMATGLGWVLGGPLGAAVVGGTTYLLNQLNLDGLSESDRAATMAQMSGDLEAQREMLCRSAAQTYLREWSQGAIAALNEYERAARLVLAPRLVSPSEPALEAEHQLRLVQGMLAELETYQSEASTTLSSSIDISRN